MEILKFNVDQDRRNLVSNKQEFKVDFKKSPSWIQARQYENQMRQVQVRVVHGDNSPFDLTDVTPMLEGWMPDGTHRIIDNKHGVLLDPQNGVFRFDFPAPVFAVAGSYKQIFFRLWRHGKNIATLEFSMEVLADKVIDGLIPRDYVTPFEDIYDKMMVIYKNADDKFKAQINAWQQQVTKLLTGLNGDYASMQTTVTSLNTQLSTLADKIKANGLLTQSDFNPIAQEIKQARQPVDAAAYPNLSKRLDNTEKLGLTKMYFPKLGDWQEDIGLLKLAGKWILIDTGDDRDWGHIKQFILRHTNRIDLGIISHYHDDHVGNVINLIKDADIKTQGMTWYVPPMPTLTGLSLVTDALANLQMVAGADGETVNVVATDLKIKLDKLTTIQFLNTSAESYEHYYDIKNTAYNNYSMVALIKYNTTELFFAGDLQGGGIDWLMTHYAAYLHPVDFLKINHHAYDADYAGNFYTKIKPTAAIAMQTKTNYMQAVPGYQSRGIASAAINVLHSLGTQISFAFDNACTYTIAQNGVTATQTSNSLRGTTKPARISYFVQANDDMATIADGSEAHPFGSLDELMAHVEDIANIKYELNILPGNYPTFNLNDLSCTIAIAAAGAIFDSIKINNCNKVVFTTDVHTSSVADRAVDISFSRVFFNAKLINDDRTADIKTIDASRFLRAEASQVYVVELACNHRSVAAEAAAAAQIAIYHATGGDNLYGVVAHLGNISINNLWDLKATTLRYEEHGTVAADIRWQPLTLVNGYASSGFSFCVKGDRTYIRGAITSNNWVIGRWTTIAHLPGAAVVGDRFLYHFTATATNGAVVPVAIEHGAIKIHPTAKPDLVGISFNFLNF